MDVGCGEWVVIRGETALGVLVDEDWEDLRRMMVGRRLVEEELATKEGFFFEGLVELDFVVAGGGGDEGD